MFDGLTQQSVYRADGGPPIRSLHRADVGGDTLSQLGGGSLLRPEGNACRRDRRNRRDLALAGRWSHHCQLERNQAVATTAPHARQEEVALQRHLSTALEPEFRGRMTANHTSPSVSDVPARITRSPDAMNIAPFRSRLDCFKFSSFAPTAELRKET